MSAPNDSQIPELLRGVLDSATSGIMAIRPERGDDGRIEDFTVLLANAMSERLTGLRAGDLLGRRLLDLFPGHEASGLPAMYARVAETGERARLETRYRDDRLDIWLDVSAVKAGDALVVTFTDVSAYKRTERELVARSAELAGQKAFAERVLEHVTTGICYFDRDLIFRLVNRTYCGLMGLPPEQLLGRHAYDVAPGSEEGTLALFRGVLDRGETHGFQAVPFTVRGADGIARETFWDATYLPMRAEGADEVEGILVLCDQVSDRLENARLQAERIEVLEASNRHKEEFLRILSHELRTPINAIMGFASVLHDEVAGPLAPGQRPYLTKILGGTDRLLALIDDLLDMSRIRAGRFVISPRAMDLPAIAREAVAALRPLADQKRLRLDLEEAHDLPALHADPQRIEQVLTNLLGNAIKFTPEGGTIAVRVRRQGDRTRVEVADTGIGIPATEHERIFDAFTQVDMSNTRQAGGTGLGLAIARSLVEAHGGELGVESEPGRGSTFWFELPFRAPA